MPFTKKLTTFDFEVTGEEPMRSVHNPEAALFVPAHARVTIDGDRFEMHISGPELNKAGKQLKRWTLTGFDLDEIDSGEDNSMPIPQWAIDLAAQVRP